MCAFVNSVLTSESSGQHCQCFSCLCLKILQKRAHSDRTSRKLPEWMQSSAKKQRTTESIASCESSNSSKEAFERNRFESWMF